MVVWDWVWYDDGFTTKRINFHSDLYVVRISYLFSMDPTMTYAVRVLSGRQFSAL